MSIVIGEQLRAALLSLALGAVLATVYDLLGALRAHRRRGVRAALADAAFCVLTAAALLAFSMRVGGGELRLYMALGVALGAAGAFALLSPVLRPLWDFWAGVLGALVRLARLPIQRAKNFYGKLHKLSKKLFLFAENSFIMKNWQRSARSSRLRAEKREGYTHGRAAEKGPRGRFSGGKAADSGAAGAGGRAASVHPRAKPRRGGGAFRAE